MTNFKQYFRAHLKANLKFMIYTLSIVLVVTFLISANGQSISYDLEPGITETYYSSMISLPVIVSGVLAFMLPVKEFSFFKKRINLDCVYSLPISRKAMGAVHYLTGVVTLFTAFTLSYLLNFGILLTHAPDYYNFQPMIGHYFLNLLLSTAIYSVMVFVFDQANTKGDGIWFMILYTNVFSTAASVVSRIVGYERLAGLYADTPFGAYSVLTDTYLILVETDWMGGTTFWKLHGCVGWLIFWVVLGICAAAGLFLTFGKRRMEKVGEISDSYFGFRSLIPFYAASSLVLSAGEGLIGVEILALLGYAIYRRGFHYKKRDIITLGVLFAFGIIAIFLFG